MEQNIINEYNINTQDIIDIITKGISKFEKPDYTINKVYYFVSDCIKESQLKLKILNNEDNINKYFEMKDKYCKSIEMIKLKYMDKWKEIDTSQVSYDTIYENFSELENDINFIATTEIIDSINNEASKEINTLINNISKLLRDEKLDILSPQIKIYFDNMMDQIYEKVILSKNFDKYIHDIIVDMYGVQKSIHRMSLSLESCSNVLNMFMQKV